MAKQELVPSEVNVALLAGGRSSERDVSIDSGKGAAEALKAAGFPVTVLDPASHDDLKMLVNGGFDVAFICLHGEGGEDGAIQGMLETIGIPYTGPGIWASATAMDKAKAKVFYEHASIPTPPSMILHARSEASSEDVVRKLGEHVVVKPANEGSAIGVTIVDDPAQIDKALDEAFSMDTEAVVERFVAGTELTVAVIGNAEAHALPVIKIVPQDSFYDYHSKYAPGGAQHICPAPFDQATTDKIQSLAVRVHNVLGCRGVSRTDMILDADGKPWVLETNTIPGMTSTSLLPDAARAAGIEFPQLCTMLVEYALEQE